MAHTIDLVVFDMAGTTVKDDGGQVARCLREALCERGYFVYMEDINHVMGRPKPEAIGELIQLYEMRMARARNGGILPLSYEVYSGVVPEVHGKFVDLMQTYYRDSPEVTEIPGAEAVFQRLRSLGIKVALDTGFSRSIVDVLLSRLGWTVGGTVDAVVTSDEVMVGRPAPDLIFEAMRRCHVGFGHLVAKVGDTPSDLLSGTAAGCRAVVGVLSGSHTLKSLNGHPHTNIIQDVTEIPSLVLHLDPEAA